MPNLLLKSAISFLLLWFLALPQTAFSSTGFAHDQENGYLYWSGNDAGQGFLRLDLETLAIEEIVSTAELGGHIRAMAFDQTHQHFYVTTLSNPGPGIVMKRIDANGANLVTIQIMPGDALSFTVDSVNEKLYWSEISAMAGWSYKIYRSNTDGSNLELVMMTTGESNYIGNPRIDATNNKIYFAKSQGSVWKINFDASEQEKVLELNPYGNVFNGMKVHISHDLQKLYFLHQESGPLEIYSANFDGSSSEKLVSHETGGIFATDLGIDLFVDSAREKIYWMYVKYPDLEIRSANLDGSNVEILCINPTDSDGDGVADCNDECPDDPDKSAPGVCGCGKPEVDEGGGSAPSCIDLCPSDPAKTIPGECGCGVADKDSDGDGTPNCLDECQLDSLKLAPGLCGCGIIDLGSNEDNSAKCYDPFAEMVPVAPEVITSRRHVTITMEPHNRASRYAVVLRHSSGKKRVKKTTESSLIFRKMRRGRWRVKYRIEALNERVMINSRSSGWSRFSVKRKRRNSQN